MAKNLERISVGIKTFLRDPQLLNTIQAIKDTMPEVKMVIADCGEMTDEKEKIYAGLERDGHKVIVMDFDAGFGAMSNAISRVFQTDFLLIGSDDFDFRPPEVRAGIERLLDVLEKTDVDIGSGRVNGVPYEFMLEDLGDTIIEHRVNPNLNQFYVLCDLTVNYSLIRRRVFSKIRWDQKPDIPHSIGGCEHGCFFVDVKRAGYKVAYVPSVEIREQQNIDSPRYRQFRARASDPGRACCDLRGIRKYILGSGKIDYEKM